MNNVIDEVLAGNPKYTLTYNDNTTATGVSIDLETPVTTPGTPLNKALFDSIQADLNTRLLIASKSTTEEAQTGSDDTKYMTSLKVKQRQQSLTKAVNLTSTASATTFTIFDFTTATGNVIEISGSITAGGATANSSIVINGSGVAGRTTNNLSVTEFFHPRNNTQGFHLRFDLNSKTFTGVFGLRAGSSSTTSTTYYVDQVTGYFTSLTSLQATLRGGASITTVNATITQNY